MARDSGRYDQFTNTWVDDNVRIDFAWGNIPIQPNDDRGMAQLDPELDNHIIATDGWSSFPEFEPNVGFDPQTAIVPDLLGMDTNDAQTLLNTLGLVPNASYVTEGATAQNADQVKTQSIAAGTVVDLNTEVILTVYNYIPAPINHSIAGIRHDFGGSTHDSQTFFMFLLGQNHSLFNGNSITISGSDVAAYNGQWIVLDSVNDNAFNSNGTKVTIYWNGLMTETANATTGTYTKN